MTDAGFLRHVHLHVANVGAVADWYQSTLGLKAVFELPGKLTILEHKGDCQLGFEAGEPPGNPSAVHLIFRTDDVDQLFTRLEALQVENLHPPEDQPYGHRVLWFNDPAGHVVEFYTPLPGDRPYD